MTRRIVAWAAVAALAVVFVLAGWSLLFSTFMIYDDEGYVLLSLQNFGRHGSLYDQVYSQYGPFYFVLLDALHRLLAFEWTNTAGRWITLMEWSLTAALCGAIVWRRMRSAAAALCTAAGVFTYLWVMIHEPIHPGGMIGLFVALAAWIGLEWDPAVHRKGAAAIGAIGAALLLTKINVGGFLLIAAAAWLAIHAAGAWWQRWGVWLAAAALTLLPWFLMRSLATQAWVLEFAAIATCSAVSAVLAGRTAAQPVAGRRQLLAFVVGATAVAITTVALTVARGSSLTGLINGILWEPLRHPGVYFFAFNWRPGSLLAAIAGLALVWLAVTRPSELVRRTVAAVRWMAVLAAALAALQVLPIALAPLGLSYGVALAGLCALPLRRDPDGLADARARQWLALLLVLQMLHAFPVVGSQLNWGTFLWVPLIVLAVRDAWLARPLFAPARHKRVLLVGGFVAFALATFMGATLLRTGWQNRHQGAPLRLPGAEDIVVPDNTVFGLRIAAANARAHSGTLFSLPGLYSFNLWTGCPTPTLANATHWFSLLTADTQRAIITRLHADPRAMVIVQLDTFRYLGEHGFPIQGPLASYLAGEFAPAFEVDSYAVWVRRGRTLAPLYTGKLRAAAGSDSAAELELVLPALPAPAARVEVWDLAAPGRSHRLSLSVANATVQTRAIDEAGRATETARAASWPIVVAAPFNRVVLNFSPTVSAAAELVAFVLDAEGRELAAARILL